MASSSSAQAIQQATAYRALDAANEVFRPRAKTTDPKRPLEICVTKVEIEDELPLHDEVYSREAHSEGRWKADEDGAEVRETTRRLQPIVHGVTEAGESVTLFVKGFLPTVTFELGDGVSSTELIGWLKANGGLHLIRSEEERHEVKQRMRTWGYDAEKGGHAFAKRRVVVFHLSSLYRMRKWRMEGAKLTEKETSLHGAGKERFRLVEPKVDPLILFDEATGMHPCGWVRVRDVFHSPDGGGPRFSHSAIEGRCSIGSIEPFERDSIPPLLVLSFDIETYSKSGDFPDANKAEDFICNVSCEASWYGLTKGADEEAGFDPITFLFYVGESNPLQLEGGGTQGGSRARMIAYETESDMLNGFAEFVSLSCPQFLLSFNGMGFDYAYIWTRAEMVRARRMLLNGGGRLLHRKGKLHTKKLDSAARGSNDMQVILATGLNHIDLYKEAQARYSMDSYSLKSCCKKFLAQDDNKVDLPYQELFRLVGIGAQQRALKKRARETRDAEMDARAEAMREEAREGMRLVLEYAKVDAELPRKLCDAMCCIVSLVEMSRVTKTPLEWLVLRGQQCKIYALLYRSCHDQGRYLNDPMEVSPSDTFEGASVLEPTPGYYTDPVATLDFASLYPSIMRAENLCFSTLLTSARAHERFPEGSYNTFTLPDGRVIRFVHQSLFKGVLPEILTQLVQARKVAKRAMNAATDPMAKMIQNQRQLALKVTCNSVYGFCASQFYPCKLISECVTCKGREMIADTKRLSEEYVPEWALASVPSFRPEVVYGDTDSVMVLLRGASLEEAWRWGEELSAIANDHFKPPNELEMEEIKMPFLLIKKKRYVARSWVKQSETEVLPSAKLDYKGIEVKRRDNASIVKETQRNLLLTLFAQHLFEKDAKWRAEVEAGRLSSHFDHKNVFSTLQTHLAQLVDDVLPIGSYVLSKTLKRAEEYKNDAHPHLHVVRLKEKRVPGSGNRCGERVEFFYREKDTAERKRPKSADKLSMRAEDPEYAVANGVRPDRESYLKAVRSAVESVMSVFDQDKVKQLFDTALETVRRQTEQKWMKESGQTNIMSFLCKGGGGGGRKRSGEGALDDGESRSGGRKK